MKLLDLIGKELLFFDGAMGTLLQEQGITLEETPEYWSIDKPEILTQIHYDYLMAGCHIIGTNTFGANDIKLPLGNYSSEALIKASISNAKKAIEKSKRKDAFVALDIGPTGKLLAPLGDLSFNDAYNSFAKMVIAGQEADLILIETMTDTYELKAAVLAAKENSNLPIFASVMLDEKGKLLTGGDPLALVALLEGLGVTAIGLNCGFGPDQLKPLVKELISFSSVPVFVNPNAGLPISENGNTVFTMDPEEFSMKMEEIATLGPWLLGGCCGTTPDHIKALISKCKNHKPKPLVEKSSTLISSYTHGINIKERTTIIGEKINPTGNKSLSSALREENFPFIINLASQETQAGAEILDVNVGSPDIDEAILLPKAIAAIQGTVNTPLMIDTSNLDAMEAAARIYNGKPIINSVNGKSEVMEKVFPIAKKYGALIVALTIDENGIPKTAHDRFLVAKKIIETGAKYGIKKKDFLVDPLTMTIGTNSMAAEITLDALKEIKEKLQVATTLGVSNVSFGLPHRSNIHTTFYTLAMKEGLDSAILNPFDDNMMNACFSFRALNGQDPNCLDYISRFEGKECAGVTSDTKNLSALIEMGLKEEVKESALALLKNNSPLDVINKFIIPALTRVGENFEKGSIFLPQLLISAEAASLAFNIVQEEIPTEDAKEKGKIILATVKGDIHDIGKNIVKVLLESYGYNILDLGKDVPPELIVETAKRENVTLVGLSALMTTTVPYMAKTIDLLRKANLSCKVVVGGAVLTEEFSKQIGADFYAKDAMAAVHLAEEYFS